MNDGWIEWVWSEEKQYPETLETRVDVKYRNSMLKLSRNRKVRYFHDQDPFFSDWYNINNHALDITHYKLAEGN